MGCFRGRRQGSMFRGLSRAQSNAQSALASWETRSVLACFAPNVLFSFSSVKFEGLTGTFGHSNKKPAEPHANPTLPHFFGFWGAALRTRPWGVRGAEKKREVLVLGVLLQEPPHYLSGSNLETSFVLFAFYRLDSSTRKGPRHLEWERITITDTMPEVES